MATPTALVPSAQFRRKLRQRGGAAVARCYQCATCSTVCELATPDAPFPRRQMLEAQWGLADRLAGDPALWLCYQCNDCSARCPRNARPGDVMQVLRALTVEALAAPRFMGNLVGHAARTWPLLIGVPIAFWIVLLWVFRDLAIPEAPLVYEDFVPHIYIYIVYGGVSVLVLWSMVLSGKRLWDLMGAGATRRGSFLRHLVPVLVEVATHRRFAQCGQSRPRRWAHFALLWGFGGAAFASALLIVEIYVLGTQMPMPQTSYVKIIANGSAVLLVVGGLMLLASRLEQEADVGATTAFDAFFLGVVLLVIFTGVATEAGRYVMTPTLACYVYVVHLGAVLTLFMTTPYSKFAHLVYRTLAMVHERMVALPQLPEGKEIKVLDRSRSDKEDPDE